MDVKDIEPFYIDGANMSSCFTLLVCLLIKFKLALWISQVKIQRIFSLYLII